MLMGLATGVLSLAARAEEPDAAAAGTKAVSSGESPATAAPTEAAASGQGAVRLRRVEDRNAGKRLGLIVGGTLAFGVTYGLPCAGGRGLWCMPFAGPVLVLAKRERKQSQSMDAGEDGIVPPAFIYVVAGGLGMLQLGGAAMITIGALLPRREVEVPARRVALLPVLGPSGAGLTAVGTW